MKNKKISKKNDLLSQLREVEHALKTLQSQFRDIKKRAIESVSASQKKADNDKILEIRKQLGLEQ